MIDVAETGTGLRAVDEAKNELAIRSPDWEGGGPPRRIDRTVDATVAGRATALRFPKGAVCIESAGRDRWRIFGSGLGPVRLGRDDHVVQVEASITAYVRFEGGAAIRRVSEGGDVVVEFPERTAMTIGLRSRIRRPTRRIAVPPTTDGLAAAVTRFGDALDTTTPDRSYPSLRSHPPLVELDADADVPDVAPEATRRTGITLRVPDDVASLFVAAPLAYYLQATVVTGDRDAPRLEAPDADLGYDFEPLPAFGDDVADLLRRVFLLDCLVRNAGPYGTDLDEQSLLGAVGVDPGRAYAASPAARLAAYLDAPFDAIDADLPGWHLATYVEPTFDHARSLPHLLDRLSLIYLPSAVPLDRGELVERSLEDFYRSAAGGQGSEPGAVEPMKPELGRGRVHGWMADGVPIDVFKIPPEAFENRVDYLDRTDATKTVTVVLNEPAMDDEQSAVADIYRERAGELSIDVAIERGLDRDELAAVFERPTDFVHYIGHCDGAGLRCADGNLAVADIEASRVQTFFLNACGSYREGLDLVRKGSVAGAVTLDDVLDEQATRVGTTFARLIMHGYSIEQSLRLARRRAIVNKQYLVVGDGTHTLLQGDDRVPLTTTIESTRDRRFSVAHRAFSPRDMGGCYQSYLPGDDTMRLFGTATTVTIPKSKLVDHLRRTREPTVYDGKYYWSGDLADMIAS